MFETNLLTFFSGLSITCLDRSGEGDSRFPDHHWPIIFDDAGVALVCQWGWLGSMLGSCISEPYVCPVLELNQ